MEMRTEKGATEERNFPYPLPDYRVSTWAAKRFLGESVLKEGAIFKRKDTSESSTIPPLVPLKLVLQQELPYYSPELKTHAANSQPPPPVHNVGSAQTPDQRTRDTRKRGKSNPRFAREIESRHEMGKLRLPFDPSFQFTRGHVLEIRRKQGAKQNRIIKRRIPQENATGKNK